MVALSGNNSTLESTFNPPIELNADAAYAICLVNLNVYNSIPNVDASNDAFVFRDGERAKWQTVRIPHGTYEIDAISTYLNKAINDLTKKKKKKKQKKKPASAEAATAAPAAREEEDSKGKKRKIDDVDDDDDEVDEKKSKKKKKEGGEEEEDEMDYEHDRRLVLTPNNNTLKCEIKSKFEIDFARDGTVGPLLGFTRKRHLKPDALYESDGVVDIMKVNNIFVRCNIATGAYLNGLPNHSLFSFYPNADPGYKIIITPSNWLFLPIVETDKISRIVVDLVDQNGRPVDFRGEELTITLYVKKV